MSLIEYFNSNPFIYEFTNDGQVHLFNRKKRVLYIWMQIIAFYETIKTLVNGYVNSNHLRLYLSDFVVTWSSFQNIFNFSILVCYILLLRLSFYLLRNSGPESSKKFQYMRFLAESREKDLVERHHFTPKYACSYLKQRRFWFELVKLNTPGYCIACACLIARVILAAYPAIPLHWLLLSTIPNSISYLSAIITTFLVFNCFNLTFFSGCFFTLFKLKSLSHQRHYLRSTGSERIERKKLISITKTALVGLNEVIGFFQASQSDYNNTICEL